MIITYYSKRRKCWVYDVKLRNEHGKMQYFACGHTSKTLVREYEAKLKNKIKEWRMFPERKIKPATFEEFVNNNFLPDYANSLSRKRDYESMCRKLVRNFSNTPMESLATADAEAYLTRRYSEVSVYMANREFYCLKAIFSKAESWGYRTKGTNPCRIKKRGEADGIQLRKEEPRFRVLTAPEVDSLLFVCQKGPSYFYLGEFTEDYTVEKLCRSLIGDGYKSSSQSTPHTLQWLNDILLDKSFYSHVKNAKSHQLRSKRAEDIKRKYAATNDEADLKRLNRVLIEEFYSRETPKMPKKAVGLTERQALELRDQIEITLHAGPRKDELLNIKVGDINFETGMLQILGKGQKIRFVPMNTRVWDILKRRLPGRKNYIFGNGNVAPKDFRTAFKAACVRAGIKDCRPHDLRRTFGTRCAMATVPPKTLQKWMGHKDIETTLKYYVQIPEDFEREAIERLKNFRKEDSQRGS